MSLQSKYSALCKKIGVLTSLKTQPDNNGAAHAEFFDNKYFYICTERGNVFKEKSTQDEDEALFWFVSDVVAYVAVDYAREHVSEGTSFGSIVNAKTFELLHKVNPNWVHRTNS